MIYNNSSFARFSALFILLSAKLVTLNPLKPSPEIEMNTAETESNRLFYK